jgi:MFS transporter, PHS family, inorganic phosphate transporter
MYGLELIIMIIASLNLALCVEGQSIRLIGPMVFWRVILGIGIGADYPNSSVLVSEFATVRWRGAMIGAVFAFQGLGAFAAALVSLLCTLAFGSSLKSTTCDKGCQLALDKSWRIIYGLGILPAVIALYFRLTIPETIRYTLDIRRNESAAALDAAGFTDGHNVDQAPKLLDYGLHLPGGFHAPPKASLRDFKRYFGLWKNGKVLLGTAGSWFLLDVAFVRKSLYQF